MTYTYKVKNAKDSTYKETVPTKVGEYTVKATIAATTYYHEGTATANFEISKAAGSIRYKTTKVTKTYSDTTFINAL